MRPSPAEVAVAAARTRLLAERLGETERDELIRDWTRMLDDLENPRTSRTLTLTDFRGQVERRLSDLVKPTPTHTSDEGLVVAGAVDRDTDEGKQAWRTIKAGTAGFSIGYLAESKARKGGGRTITEIDLLEISVTSKPMHPATRTLGWKSQPTPRIVSFKC